MFSPGATPGASATAESAVQRAAMRSLAAHGAGEATARAEFRRGRQWQHRPGWGRPGGMAI